MLDNTKFMSIDKPDITADTRSDLPAVGFIVSEDQKESVTQSIRRGLKHDRAVLVTYQDEIPHEVLQIAEDLGGEIIHPSDPSADEGTLKTELACEVRSRGFPGVILKQDLTATIDYNQTTTTREDDSFFVDTVPVSTEKSYNRDGIVAILPAYNEADTLENVIETTKSYVEDVIVVNDASTDDTAAVAEKHADGVVTHPENMGVGAAVHTGYQAAIQEGYDIVVQIDGDGQHDPSYIPEMVSVMREDDADMVIGSRWQNSSYQNYSLVRRSGIQFFTFEANMLGGLDITDVTSGYRVYDTALLEELGRPENSHWALEQTLEVARKGYSIAEVSVPMPPATEGSQFDIGTFLKYPPRMILITLKVLLFR